ncbi:MAG: hypothetical protein ACPHO8_12355 [Mariniblastus sp.]
MNWFQKLTGLEQESELNVRQHLQACDGILSSNVNGASYAYGYLEVVALGELRKRVAALPLSKDLEESSLKISVRETVADVQDLHRDAENHNAIFQVASQFNLLEMIGPGVLPEAGVGIYEKDFTQGPACAVAAGAATIYRNYFVEIDGKIGQNAERQIDTLKDLGALLGNTSERLWEMQNGYALASESGLAEISAHIANSSVSELDCLRDALKIGLQWGVEVTLSGSGNRVTQAFCSALPVAYSRHESSKWEAFARLVLEASYEAVFCSAILNQVKTGSGKVFLTLLGGGAFGNEFEWILSAIERSLNKYQCFDLEIDIVSYRSSRPDVAELVERWTNAS